MTRVESVHPSQSPAVDALMAACLAADGYAFLELEASLNVHRDMNSLFLAYEGGSLTGALYIFAPRSDEAEVGALVLPACRRRGVFTALLEAARAEIAAFGYRDILFVVDSRSDAGKSLAAGLGARYEYSEYAMRYPKGSGGSDTRSSERRGAARLDLRLLGPESIDELVGLRAAAFGDAPEDAESFERAVFASPGRRNYGASLGGRLVGACSLGYEGARVSINGLVVEPASRGEGIGQAILAKVLGLLDGEVREIALDVDSLNANAYHIYLKAGFEVYSAREYHRLSLR
jgi:ribosomal protein S18 acetylase RimI-like enzyme